MAELRCAVEFRADEARRGPGRLYGQLLAYGVRAEDRAELFEPGSLRWPKDGVILNRQHSRSAPIARFTPEVRGAALIADIMLPDTSAGRDAAQEVRGGLFRGLSVEFIAEEQEVRDGIRRIQRAELRGAALVDSPSYPGSLEIRAVGAWRRRRRLWL